MRIHFSAVLIKIMFVYSNAIASKALAKVAMAATIVLVIFCAYPKPSRKILASVSSVHVKSMPFSLSMVIRSLFSPFPTVQMIGSSRTSSKYTVTIILSAQLLTDCVIVFRTSAKAFLSSGRFSNFALTRANALFRVSSEKAPEV